jgi:hypothetical protein
VWATQQEPWWTLSLRMVRTSRAGRELSVEQFSGEFRLAMPRMDGMGADHTASDKTSGRLWALPLALAMALALGWLGPDD